MKASKIGPIVAFLCVGNILALMFKHSIRPALAGDGTMISASVAFVGLFLFAGYWLYTQLKKS
jgi:lipopolysaccharide export LptBFGC system permease protein LptF